jgi:hypothetical protein
MNRAAAYGYDPSSEVYAVPPVDQCPECRAAPGSAHAPECDCHAAPATRPEPQGCDPAVTEPSSTLPDNLEQGAEGVKVAGRYFETGAYRDTDENKPDYEGFLSPLVIRAFGAYMAKHRVQSDGHLRDSDNWQKGIPRDQYMKSAWRHFLDLWLEHRSVPSRDGLDEALGGLLFNICGYWHETLKERS